MESEHLNDREADGSISDMCPNVSLGMKGKGRKPLGPVMDENVC